MPGSTLDRSRAVLLKLPDLRQALGWEPILHCKGWHGPWPCMLPGHTKIDSRPQTTPWSDDGYCAIGRIDEVDHEILPPDLTEPANAWRVLGWLASTLPSVAFGHNQKGWWCVTKATFIFDSDSFPILIEAIFAALETLAAKEGE